jgi:hypothetical protein
MTSGQIASFEIEVHDVRSRSECPAQLIGIILAGLNGLLNFLWLPVAPVSAAILIAIDVLIIWALANLRKP